MAQPRAENALKRPPLHLRYWPARKASSSVGELFGVNRQSILPGNRLTPAPLHFQPDDKSVPSQKQLKDRQGSEDSGPNIGCWLIPLCSAFTKGENKDYEKQRGECKCRERVFNSPINQGHDCCYNADRCFETNAGGSVRPLAAV
jgi:hypothetical protein